MLFAVTEGPALIVLADLAQAQCEVEVYEAESSDTRFFDERGVPLDVAFPDRSDRRFLGILATNDPGPYTLVPAASQRPHLRSVLPGVRRIEPNPWFASLIDVRRHLEAPGTALLEAQFDLHSANGITAMFIATGQDVANVSESSAGVLYCELTPQKDLDLLLIIPSLIVATYGGGTGLATQREALAGEISLASAISSSDWVSSHEQYDMNR